jgi:tetratricopeptide (TPR) repeat protein
MIDNNINERYDMKTTYFKINYYITCYLIFLLFVACGNDSKSDDHIIVYRYFKLLVKSDWTLEDRTSFIQLFSTRGLNKFLQVHNFSSFSDFDAHKRSIPEASCDFNELDPSFKVTQKNDAKKLSLILKGDVRIIRPVWYAKGEIIQPFVTQLVLKDELIYDLKIVPVEKKESIHPILGIIFSILLVTQMRLRRNIFNNTRMNRFVVFLLMLGTLIIVSGFFYGLYQLGGTSFKKVVFNPRPGFHYGTNWDLIDTPYGGEQGVGIIENALRIVKTETNELLQRSREGSDLAIAQSFFDRGISSAIQADYQNTNKAITLLTRAIENNFGATAFIELARCYLALGEQNINPLLNFIRAEGILNTIVNNDSFKGYKPQINALLSIIHKLKNEEAKAQEYYSQIPNRAENLSNEIFLEVKLYLEKNQAIKMAISDQLISLSPENPRYYIFKGIAAQQTGRDDIARLSFQVAIDKNSEYQFANTVMNDFIHKKQLSYVNLRDNSILIEEPATLPFHSLFIFADVLTANYPEADLSLQKQTLNSILFPIAPLRKYGFVGVLGLRKSDARRISALIIFATVLIIGIVKWFNYNHYRTSVQYSFWFFIFIISLYTCWWGIDGKESWTWIIVIFIFILSTISSKTQNTNRRIQKF